MQPTIRWQSRNLHLQILQYRWAQHLQLLDVEPELWCILDFWLTSVLLRETMIRQLDEAPLQFAPRIIFSSSGWIVITFVDDLTSGREPLSRQNLNLSFSQKSLGAKHKKKLLMTPLTFLNFACDLTRYRLLLKASRPQVVTPPPPRPTFSSVLCSVWCWLTFTGDKAASIIRAVKSRPGGFDSLIILPRVFT